MGHFYNVITHGYGAMYSYAARIPVQPAVGHRRLHPGPPVQPGREAGRPPPRAEAPGRGRLRPGGPTQSTARAWPRSRNEPGRRVLPPPGTIRTRALIVGPRALRCRCSACWPGSSSTASRFDRAYLFTLFFLLGLSLGSLALIMLHRQLGGAWGFLIRRPPRPPAPRLPLVALFFVPVMTRPAPDLPLGRAPARSRGRDRAGSTREKGAPSPPTMPEAKGNPVRVANEGVAGKQSGQVAGPGSLGVRRDPLEEETTDLFAFKRMWLNPTWFAVRLAIYFAIWIVLAMVLTIGSRRQDEPGRTGWPMASMALHAGPGDLLPVGLVRPVDWGMSLEPTWYSSLYGVILMISQGISTLALMIIVATLISPTGETTASTRPRRSTTSAT